MSDAEEPKKIALNGRQDSMPLSRIGQEAKQRLSCCRGSEGDFLQPHPCGKRVSSTGCTKKPNIDTQEEVERMKSSVMALDPGIL